MIRVTPLELGPPVGWPLKFRVSGPTRRPRCGSCAGVRRRHWAANPNVQNINFDWSEMSKTVKVEIDQDRARAARAHVAADRQQHQRRAVGHDHHAAAR